MQVGCTKKTQDFLKKELSNADPRVDQFFTWSASLTSVGCRKTLVVVNDLIRCGFVLHGVTAAMTKKMDELIFKGIEHMLLCQQIAPELISRYLNDCGKTIIYTSIRDRKTVARLNKATMFAHNFQEGFAPEQLLQPMVVRRLNKRLYREEKEYFCVEDRLQQIFAKRYKSKNLFRCACVVLNVKLLDIQCFRQLRVPEILTMTELHKALQQLFCWYDEHLHEFISENNESLDIVFPEYARFAQKDDIFVDTTPIEKILSVKEMFSKRKKFWYLYDFGDGWEHEIELVRFEDNDTHVVPCCLSAVGDAPPEDVGGPEGFEDFCKIIKDPTHSDYLEISEWADRQCWEPLNIEQINRKLCSL